MSLWYRVLYGLGIRPWDRDGPVPELVAVAGDLPPARALDLGCGTGAQAVYLAAEGWDVVAVDAVPRALSAARRRASAAGVTVDFRRGDVAELEALGIGDVGLAFDRGCFHGLPHAARDGYARGVTAVTRPGGAAAAHGVPGTDRPRAAARREPGGGARALRPALAIGVRGARAGHPGRRPYRARPPDLVSVRARMSPPPLRVRALLRTATDAEITEALERNPGSARLRTAGYEPAWFELDVEVEDEGATDSQFGVVWAEPGLSREALANDELEQALEATLQGLRDFEGIEVERDEIPDEAIDLRVED